jgi:molecular chaperone GrpE (heat shock protein)
LSYQCLIPHLIESVKELSKENAELQSSNKNFKEQNARILSKLEALENRLNDQSQSAEAKGRRTK